MDHNRPLRHALAALAYRMARATGNATPEFAKFETGSNPRTPDRILAHMGDLIDWAVSLVEGNQKWHEAEPLPWPEEVARFFRGLKTLDERIAAADLSEDVANRLFQGPIADALTHTGQLAMLRRMAGCPIAGENYFIADIAIGCVGDGAVAAAQELLIMPAPGPESPLNGYPEGCTRSKWKCGSGKIKTRGCIA